MHLEAPRTEQMKQQQQRYEELVVQDMPGNVICNSRGNARSANFNGDTSAPFQIGMGATKEQPALLG